MDNCCSLPPLTLNISSTLPPTSSLTLPSILPPLRLNITPTSVLTPPTLTLNITPKPRPLTGKGQSRCGAHVGLQKTVHETLLMSRDMKCMQIYLGSHISYECRTISAEEKEKINQCCAEHDQTFYVHCPLIANLAKVDSQKSVNIVCKELQQVTGLPCACVLHIGKVGTLHNVADRINEMSNAGYLQHSNHSRVPYHLLLEVAAGQGTELGTNWEEIRKLYEGIDKTQVGLCLDTQHAFASGLCKFETHEDIVKMYDDAQSFAKKAISLIHLNDSFKEYGSRVDRHAPLKAGFIWYKNTESLQSLVSIAKEYSTDLVSETGDTYGDICVVNDMLRN